MIQRLVIIDFTAGRVLVEGDTGYEKARQKSVELSHCLVATYTGATPPPPPDPERAADRAALQKAEDVLACVDEADIPGAIEALAAVRERLGEEKPVT